MTKIKSVFGAKKNALKEHVENNKSKVIDITTPKDNLKKELDTIDEINNKLLTGESIVLKEEGLVEEKESLIDLSGMPSNEELRQYYEINFEDQNEDDGDIEEDNTIVEKDENEKINEILSQPNVQIKRYSTKLTPAQKLQQEQKRSIDSLNSLSDLQDFKTEIQKIMRLSKCSFVEAKQLYENVIPKTKTSRTKIAQIIKTNSDK